MPKDSSRMLQGKIALVTGASRGLGAEIARTFAAAGARVVINYLSNKEAAGEVVRSIEETGGIALAAQADIRDTAAVQAMVAAIGESWGVPDVLVLNAAMTKFRPMPLSETNFERYRTALADELKGAYSPVSVLAPRMAHMGGGSITAVSSSLCRSPRPGFSELAISKGALEAFMRSVAVEYGPLGVRSNIVEASMIEGESSAFMPEEQKAALVRSIPLGRIANATDVAAAMLFAASPLAAFINGATIPVNGGQYLN